MTLSGRPGRPLNRRSFAADEQFSKTLLVQTRVLQSWWPEQSRPQVPHKTNTTTPEPFIFSVSFQSLKSEIHIVCLHSLSQSKVKFILSVSIQFLKSEVHKIIVCFYSVSQKWSSYCLCLHSVSQKWSLYSLSSSSSVFQKWITYNDEQ